MQNPLESYRRTQRELRREFDAFTRQNCATCPTPCCVRPARILPTDILIAEATGWKGTIIPLEPRDTHVPDMVAEVAARNAETLTTDPDEEAPPVPCEYLGPAGCTFPHDLRPFGCTTYICRYMYEKLDRPTLTRIKRLSRELEQKHTLLLRSVRQVAWEHNEEE